MKMPFGGRIIGTCLDVDSDRFSTILCRGVCQPLRIADLWITSAAPFAFDWLKHVTLHHCRNWKLKQNVTTSLVKNKNDHIFINRMNLKNETKCLNG